MVKKLFKHEFLAWVRIVPIFFLIAPAAAAMYQLLGLLESYSMIFDLIRGLTAITSVVSMIACVAAPIVFSITRFYKSLFTGEGYLSLTLPVKTSQQLLVKAMTAGIFSMAAVIVAVFSLMIFLAGDPLNEILLQLRTFFSLAPKKLLMHVAVYILEFAALMVMGLFSNHLQYYSCICLGQLSRKNRILAAIGAFILYFVIAQVLSVITTVALLCLEDTGFMTAYYDFSAAHPYACVHLELLFMLLLCALMSTVYYLICSYILRKKLNLE